MLNSAVKRSCWILLSLAIGHSSAVFAASSLSGGNDTRYFHIGPKPLTEALIEFARAAKINLLAPALLVKQRQAAALQGEYSTPQALRLLLKNSPLSFVVLADGSISIIKKTTAPSNAVIIVAQAEDLGTALYHPLEEVLVTAQRHSENLQQVPMAITSIDQATLERGRITSLAEASLQIPGLSMSSYSLGQPSIHMRGIGSNDDGAAMGSSVVLFVDDIYIGRISTLDLAILDVARIEALRGPQGTLYGKNAIGGAINIVSNKPTATPEVKVSLGLGNFASYEAQLLLNGALDKDQRLLGRVLIDHRQRDGWQKNIFHPQQKQMGEKHSSLRAKLSYNSQTNWRGYWSLDYSRNDLGSTGRIPVAGRRPLQLVNAQGLNSGASQLPSEIFAQLGGDYRHASNDLRGYTDRTIAGLSQKIDWDLGDFQLSSISGFRDSKFDWLEDSSGLPASATLQTVDLNVTESHRQFSQELRLSWQGINQLELMVGAYYLHESTQRAESFFFDRATAISQQDNRSNNFALFGRMEYQLRPSHFISLGGRLNFDKKHLRQRSKSDNAPAIILQDFSSSGSESWLDFSPRLAYRWQYNDELMLYSSISKGIKSGGFQGVPGTLAASQRTVDPESAWEFELGLKSQWWQDQLRLNLASFYTRYSDLQVVQFRTIDNFGVFETSNAASAILRGLEAELVYSPSEQLSFSGSYAYLDAYYDRFNSINGEDFTGNSLRQAPKNSLSLAMEFQQSLGQGRLSWYLSYRYQSESYREPDNSITIQPAFKLLDGHISFSPQHKSWQVSLWGKNLGNEAYITHLYLLGGNDYALYGTPRSYGLSLNFTL